jgi:hypothetical protein
MIRIELTRQQKGELITRCKYLNLTDAQAASVRGQLNAAKRPISCTCGTCAKCKARVRKRNERAKVRTKKQKAPEKIATR